MSSIYLAQIINPIQLSYSSKNVETAIVEQIAKNIVHQLTKMTQYLFDNKLLPISLYKKQLGLSLLLVNDIEMQNINFKWRGLSKPTNVLSMAMSENWFLEDFTHFDEVLLGDIVISLDTAMKEASSLNIDLLEYVLVLFVHGLLHIMGFDHSCEPDAKKMQQAESILLKILKTSAKSLTNNYWLEHV